MKKFIVFLSSVALVGSVSYAMDEEAMDEEMMMEVAAPLVAVGGSASIGIKNDSSADNSLELIRAYKVTFDSSGTTDGGLMFGAGISLRDDTTEEDAPTLKGSKVYIGGADGSWKVQFGGNDPGIELAGGIGLADDHFLMDDEDASISLEGSFGGTSYRLTLSDPSNSVPERTREMTTTDNVPVESGLITPDIAMIDWTTSGALMGTTDSDTRLAAIFAAITAHTTYLDTLMSVPNISFDSACGISEVPFYYTVPADSNNVVTLLWDHDGDGAAENAAATDTAPATTAPVDVAFSAGQNIPAVMLMHEANADAFADFADVTPMMTYENTADAARCSATMIGAGDTTVPVSTTTGMDNAVYTAKHLQDQWSIGFTHSLDTINIGVGMDSGKGLALGVGTELSGVGLNLYYSKSEQENFTGVVGGKDMMETQENTGLGVKASMAAGEGASVSVAYSTLKKEMMGNSMTDKKIELDFSYDLGGGATLKASVDKNDPDGGDSNTVLEAKVAMSF